MPSLRAYIFHSGISHKQAWLIPKRKMPLLRAFVLFGGERGIRTPGGLHLNGFQDRRIRPLCHLSGAKITSESLHPKFLLDQAYADCKYHNDFRENEDAFEVKPRERPYHDFPAPSCFSGAAARVCTTTSSLSDTVMGIFPN